MLLLESAFMDKLKLWNGEKINIDLNGFDGCVLMPSFCDVHVHFREPGFCYKETIETGSKAAASGGYTDVCTMPNLKPCPDSLESLNVQLDKIKETSDLIFSASADSKASI